MTSDTCGRWFSFSIDPETLIFLEKKNLPEHVASLPCVNTPVPLKTVLRELEDAGEVGPVAVARKHYAKYRKLVAIPAVQQWMADQFQSSLGRLNWPSPTTRLLTRCWNAPSPLRFWWILQRIERRVGNQPRRSKRKEGGRIKTLAASLTLPSLRKQSDSHWDGVAGPPRLGIKLNQLLLFKFLLESHPS